MSTSEIITKLLDDYKSRLGINGSANMLVLDSDISTALISWCQQTCSSNYQPTFEVAEIGATEVDKWPYSETHFSHVFASIGKLDKVSLQYLKWIQYSLQWKGIAVLLFREAGDADLIEWIERASFERGKIRVVEQDEPSKLVLAMKWDLLSA